MNGWSIKSDDAIVDLLCSREESGLDALRDKYGHYVEKFLKYKFKSLACDDDINSAINAAMYKAWENVESIRKASALKTWFVRVCHNALVDIVRKKSRQIPSALLDDHVLELKAFSDGGASDHPLALVLIWAIGLLPQLQRQIITADLENDGQATDLELAERLSTSKNSVRVSRVKARKNLHKIICEKYPVLRRITDE